jgi:hypothetical protein
LRAVALLLHVSALIFTHLGLLLVQDSNPLCPCGWGFMNNYTGLGSGVFSCLYMGSRGLIVLPSASYSQGVGFYTLFHLSQGGLAIKAVIVVKLQP